MMPAVPTRRKTGNLILVRHFISLMSLLVILLSRETSLKKVKETERQKDRERELPYV